MLIVVNKNANRSISRKIKRLSLLIIFYFLFFTNSKSQTTQLSDTIRQTHFKNGKLKDIIVFIGYDSSAKSKFLYESYNKSGQLTNSRILIADTIVSNLTQNYYFRNGAMKSQFFRPQSTYPSASDYYMGYSISYYKNRQKRDEGISLLNNGLTGLWIYYYENGVIKKQGWWKNFRKVGKWDFYNKNGILIKTKDYKY